MLRGTRVWTTLTRASGIAAAWGLAISWAHAAQPPETPPAATNDASPPPVPGRRASPPPPPRSGPAPGVGEPEPEVEQEKVDLANTWGYSRAGSPRPRYVRNTQDPIIYAPNPVGFYSGVSVQGNQTPPHPAKEVGSGPTTLTWAGFERTSTGSRVFFQLSREAEYTLSQKNGVITIRMRKTRVNVRNNLRRLDLSYFKTPVRAVKVRRKGKDAIATVSLKADATPDVSYVDSGGSGYKLLVLTFTHATGAAQAPVRTNAVDDASE